MRFPTTKPWSYKKVNCQDSQRHNLQTFEVYDRPDSWFDRRLFNALYGNFCIGCCLDVEVLGLISKVEDI